MKLFHKIPFFLKKAFPYLTIPIPYETFFKKNTSFAENTNA